MEKNVERGGRLSLALDMEYDPCNMLAYEVSELAHAEMTDGAAPEVFRIFGAGLPGEHATEVQCKFGYPAEFSGWPVDTEQIRFALIRPEGQMELENNDVSLVAVLRDDLVVRLATFDFDGGSKCPYVRIEGEPEENIVVAPYDDRQTILTEIRRVLRGQYDSLPELRQLISRQIETYQQPLQQQLLPALSRRVIYEYNKAQTSRRTRGTVGSYHVLRDGSVHQEVLRTQPTGAKEAILEDGRRVSIVLASTRRGGWFRSQQRADEVELCAVVRGDVVLPLLRFDGKTVFDVTNGEQVDHTKADSIRRAVLEPESAKRKEYETAQQAYSAKKTEKVLRRRASESDCSAAVAVLKAMVSYIDPAHHHHLADVSVNQRQYANAKETLHRWFTTDYRDRQVDSGIDLVPSAGRRGWSGQSSALHQRAQVLGQLGRTQHNFTVSLRAGNHASALLHQLGAIQNFDHYLGTYDEDSERLLTTVGRMATIGARFEGTTKTVVHGDRKEVELSASIVKLDSDATQVTVCAKPVHVAPSVRAIVPWDVVLRTTADNEMTPDDAHELRRLLGKLVLVK